MLRPAVLNSSEQIFPHLLEFPVSWDNCPTTGENSSCVGRMIGFVPASATSVAAPGSRYTTFAYSTYAA